MDRGYVAAYDSETLLFPLRRRGWDIVTDYMEHDLPPTVTESGAIIVAGTPTCPALPQHLAALNGTDLTDATRERWFAERTRFDLHAKQRPNPRTGKQRMQCPAHGPAATLVCPLRDQLHGKQPKSGMQPVRLTEKKRKRVDLPPQVDTSKIKIPPQVCKQTTVTIDLADTERTTQKYPHASPRWQHVYRNDRNLVEGANAW